MTQPSLPLSGECSWGPSAHHLSQGPSRQTEPRWNPTRLGASDHRFYPSRSEHCRRSNPHLQEGSPQSGLNNEMSAVPRVWDKGHDPQGTICGKRMKASSHQKDYPNLRADLLLNLA